MQDRIPDSASLPELTLRGLVLGALITIVFTAANLYLALKVGIGIATSIPAAVISMGVLRFTRNANMLENNIVQTVASSAGTLTAVVLSLPGLVLIGAWSGFPFWYTAGICAIGGILGVTYTVPLRRALVVETALPFPEGVAAAEILRVGAAGNKDAGLRDVVLGAVAAAGFALAGAIKLFAESFTGWIRIGGATTGVSASFSFALIGAGWLVGITVGLASLLGFVIAWGVAVPYLTLTVPHAPEVSDVAHAVTMWRTQVRFLGVGCIAVAAVWTLLQLLRPMLRGIQASMRALRQQRAGGSALPRTERDMPFNRIVQISLAMIVPLTALLSIFATSQAGFGDTPPLVLIAAAVVFVMLFGFLVAAACGYMAGLIGASNSPISGIGIVATILVAVPLAALLGDVDGGLRDAVVALIIFTVSVIVAVATISNDNLQDLKTGQLVGATPWKQQVALIVGVLVGACVIPPMMDLLYQAYGFASSLPRAGMDPRQALAAPQATLIATLTKGIVAASIDWTQILLGAAIGVALIVVDVVLQRTTRNARLPVLAVGLGIYLPAGTSIAIVLGAVLAWLLNRALKNRADREASLRRGVLLASGLIVGESLFGVALATIILATGAQEPLALLGPSFEPTADWLGGLAFLAIALFLYRRGHKPSGHETL
ncbi:OPT family oligopeptide transporter [Roseiterribacter gracilis]|uniref:Oligopeptide transporter, OPT family protein n=1 Tax=Roseiterribacter gracilis TaxID=2812848 RepID=A0A8S8XG80_9PROT|nr:oligopeptide transporter, OPT family protein [Rhodospirillales bacterium TMPK1]